MFVRIKKIKGREYAYLVENKWTSSGSRQKVSAYLGAVKRLSRVKNDWILLEGDFKSAVKSLVKQELENHGISKGQTINFDLENSEFKENGKDVVLALNEGFLCSHTLKQLLEFEHLSSEAKTGQKLASVFLEAGLQVNETAFVKLVEMIQPKKRETEPEELKSDEFYY